MATIPSGQLSRIGDGPVAAVYSGHHAGVPVALKVYPKRFDKRTLSAYQKEQAKLTAMLRVTSVLTVDGIDELDTGEPALRMELCRQSLAGHVEREGPMAPADVVMLGRAVAVALASAHQAGVVHGGISPHNVLFRVSGEPVLADFGVTLRQAFARDPLHAIEFLPPETLRTGELNESTDLYGLGAILHYALTGRSPHPGRLGEQPGERVLRILGEPVPAISNQEVPLGLSTLVARLLAANPGRRPNNTVVVANQLGDMLPNPPQRQTQPDFDDFDTPMPAPPAHAPAPVRQQRTVAPPPPRTYDDDFDDFSVPPGAPYPQQPPRSPLRQAPPPGYAPVSGPSHQAPPLQHAQPYMRVDNRPPNVPAPAARENRQTAPPNYMPAPPVQLAPPGPVQMPAAPPVQMSPPNRPVQVAPVSQVSAPVQVGSPPAPVQEAAAPPSQVGLPGVPPAPVGEAVVPPNPQVSRLAQGEVSAGAVPAPVEEPVVPPSRVVEPSQVSAPVEVSPPSGAPAPVQVAPPSGPPVREPVVSLSPQVSPPAQRERVVREPVAPSQVAEPNRASAPVQVAPSHLPQAVEHQQEWSTPARPGDSAGEFVDFAPESHQPERATAVLLPPPVEERGRRIRYDLLAGAGLVLALLALIPLLFLRNDPEELRTTPRIPEVGAQRQGDVEIVLNKPVDLMDKVELSWRASKPELHFAVVIAIEGAEEPDVRFPKPLTDATMTVDVRPGTRYCFLIQATEVTNDGEAGFYESDSVGIRGATCSQ